jgi:hypothetical protein
VKSLNFFCRKRFTSCVRRHSVLSVVTLCCGITLSCQGAAITSSSSLATTDTTINFDDPSFVYLQTDIRNQFAALGVIFGGPTYQGVNVINPNLVRYIPGASAPNAVQVVPGASGLDVEFLGPVTEFGFDYEVSLFANLTITAYSADNSLIETETFTTTSGFAGLQESTDVAWLNISSQDLRFGNPASINFGIDNFEFTAVPEPSFIALLPVLACFVYVFGGHRRRAV